MRENPGESVRVRVCEGVRLRKTEHWLPMAGGLMTSLLEHERGCHRNTSHRSLF